MVGTEKRRDAAHRYRLNLSENKKIKMMEVKEGNRCVYHIFPIFIRNRNSVQQEMLSEGVQTALHYPKPIHLQKAYKNLKHKRGGFSKSRKASVHRAKPPYVSRDNQQGNRLCLQKVGKNNLI